MKILTHVWIILIAGGLLSSSVLVSCASIPKEAAELSVQLERQLYALQRASDEMVERAYLEKERSAEAYVDNVWYPQYLEDLFRQPSIAQLWDEVIRTDSMENRMEMLMALTRSCVQQYQSYKSSLLEPIRKERDSIRKSLDEEYRLALRMNAAITRNVASGSALQEEYKSHLAKVASPERLDSLIQSSFQKIDRRLEEIQVGVDKYKEASEKVNEFINYIKEQSNED